MKAIKLAYDNGSVQKTITCFLPESWDEVSWQQFTDYQKTFPKPQASPDPDADEEAPATPEPVLSGMQRTLKHLSILSGLKVSDLEQCVFEEVLALVPHLGFLKHLEPAALDKAEKTFDIHGERYHATQIFTAADFVNYEDIEKNETLSTEDKTSLKLALFLRKELPTPGHKWYHKFLPTPEPTGKPVLEPLTDDFALMQARQRLFAQHLTVTQVNHLCAFFLKAAVESQMPTPDFGPHHQVLLRQSVMLEKLFGRVMGGSVPSGRFPRILWSLKKYYDSQLTKYFLASNTKSSSTTSAEPTKSKSDKPASPITAAASQ